MSERNKEIIAAVTCFAGAAILGLRAILGKAFFGILPLFDTKVSCVIWAFACATCGILLAIGNRRLNKWINPRLDAFLDRREEAKRQREALRMELDAKDPSRVERREERKKHLFCVIGWILLVSPLVAVATSIALIIRFKTETYYMMLAISLLYAAQLWGLMLKAYLEMKKESK